jgi:hypothetical protein
MRKRPSHQFRDTQGNIAHFVSNGKDITERKRSEEELRALNSIMEAVHRSSDLKEVLKCCYREGYGINGYRYCWDIMRDVLKMRWMIILRSR